MSDAVLDNIRTLFEAMDSHAALVEERMREAGITPDPLVAASVAKYWDALERLAAE